MAFERSIAKALLAFAALAPSASRAIETPGPLRPGEPYPNSCYLIFKTKEEAALSCPTNVPVAEFYDFWGSFRGWSCDCPNAEMGPADTTIPISTGL